MEIWQIVLLVIVGIVVGFLNVMVGGGLLFFVLIMLFFGIEGLVVNGMNRIVILV